MNKITKEWKTLINKRLNETQCATTFWYRYDESFFKIFWNHFLCPQPVAHLCQFLDQLRPSFLVHFYWYSIIRLPAVFPFLRLLLLSWPSPRLRHFRRFLTIYIYISSSSSHSLSTCWINKIYNEWKTDELMNVRMIETQYERMDVLTTLILF